MKIQLAIGLALVVLSACAQSAKRVDVDKVFSDEGVVMGRFNVIYNGVSRNGASRTKGCSVVLRTGTQDHVFPVEADGYVFATLPKGPVKIRSVGCIDTSAYSYDIEGATFTNVGGDEKTYFGDITFDWKTKGGMKGSAMFGVVGAVADASSNDGTLTMKVEDRQAETLKAWMAFVKKQDRFKPRRGLASVGK
jgi:hypothetical protein